MYHSKLHQRQLGNIDILVSSISTGGHIGIRQHEEKSGEFCDSAKEREALAIATVRRGIELGINYFDTAPMYHNKETRRLLGIALEALPKEDRRSLVISTKVGWPHAYGGDDVKRQLEESVRILGNVDIVYIHDPSNYTEMRQAFGKLGAFETLQQAKAEGVIRAVGLGVRTHHFLHYAIEEGIDVILPSFDFSPLRWSAASIIQYAALRGVGVVNASPYVGGLLAGPDPTLQAHRYNYIATNSPSDVQRARYLWEWAQTRNVSIGALAVQWSLRNPYITTTLLGPRSPDEIEQNVAHALEEIPGSLWTEFMTFVRSLGPWEDGKEQTWR